MSPAREWTTERLEGSMNMSRQMWSHCFDSIGYCVNCGHTRWSYEGKRPCGFGYLKNQLKPRPSRLEKGQP